MKNRNAYEAFSEDFDEWGNRSSQEISGDNSENSEACENDEKNRDYGFRFILAQIVICLIIFAAAFIIKTVGGDFYKTVRDKYISLFCQKTSAAEVTDAFVNIFKSGDTESSGLQNVTVTDIVSYVATPADTIPSPAKTSKKSVSDTDKNMIVKTAKSPDGISAFDNAFTSENSYVDSPIASSEASGISASISSLRSAKTGDKIIQTNLKTTNATTGESVNTMFTPVTGTITDDYGWRTHPVSGLYTFHSGIDIGCDSGTPVSAALSGCVKKATYESGYGNYIILEHGNGLCTLYAHCSSLEVSVGDNVKRGDIIALSGSTGVSTGPHLHFEVSVNSVTLNPAYLINPVV